MALGHLPLVAAALAVASAHPNPSDGPATAKRGPSDWKCWNSMCRYESNTASWGEWSKIKNLVVL